jgi:PAS domain S-box-containing protein
MSEARVSRVPYLEELQRYAIALAVTALATAVALAITDGLHLYALGLLAFPLGVLAAAWLEGMGPGILSAIGAALAVIVFYAQPVGSLRVASPKERIAVAGFAMACIVESTLVGVSRRSERGMSRMAEAITFSEQKYRVLFETNPEPMWIFDRKTRTIVAANEAALAAYGYDADEVAGLRMDALLEAGDADRFFADEEGRDRRTWRHVTKRGDRIDVETRCAVARWVGGVLGVMVVRDVTARVRSQRELLEACEELKRAKKAAEDATRARDRFLAALSHELRTPLTPALLASAALERRPSLPPEQMRRKATLIRTKVAEEARLIDDLLDIARIVNGDFKIAKTPAEVTQIVVRAVDACVEEADAKRIVLKRELAASACTARLDPDRLQAAVGAAVSSAIDAAPASSVVRVWTRHEGAGQITIGVHRDGEVVDPAAMFNPFERGAMPEAPAAWGLGLRLAIGKAVVEACGGSVEASSGRDGTSVVMKLATEPLAP